MSVTWTCDWCGHTLEEGQPWVELKTERSKKNGSGGWVAHYHAACYDDEVDAVLRLAHEFGNVLENIPVAPPRPEEAVETILDEPIWSDSPGCWPRAELIERGLSLGEFRYPRRLKDAGIRTVGDLQRAIEDRSLGDIRGVGPKTFSAIERELHQLLSGVRKKEVA